MSQERKPKKSQYTVDRGMPGAFEGETVTRRNFMNAAGQLTGAVAVGAIVLAAGGFAVGPILEEVDIPWQDVGAVDDFPDDTYLSRVITYDKDLGEAGRTTVYLRRRNDSIDTEPADQYNRVVAISSRCMHLGCPIRFVIAAERFICPCHGGVYDFGGQVAGGPPVRPLDRFYTRIRNGRVEVGRRFSVNSELERFSPRGPGQPLDGIGQYVYPSRPTLRKLPGT